MDSSAIIVVVIGSVLFFGFILWMAIYSRKNDSEKLSAEINFTEVRKRNEQFLKK
jgi:hypothetical protein